MQNLSLRTFLSPLPDPAVKNFQLDFQLRLKAVCSCDGEVRAWLNNLNKVLVENNINF